MEQARDHSANDAENSSGQINILPAATAKTKNEVTSAANSSADLWRTRWQRLFGGPNRIMGLDIARGLAVLGMIAAHVATLPALEWSKPWTWAGIALGRSSILFAVLAGVSMAIMTGGRHPYTGQQAVNARFRILVRAVALLVLGGALQAIAGSISLILEYYAIVFIVSLIFVRWPPKRLAVTIAIMVPLASVGVAYGTSLIDFAASNGLGGDTSGILTWAITGTYPLLVWLPLCLTGVCIGRLDLRSTRVAAGLCFAGLIFAVVGYTLSAVWGPDQKGFKESISTDGVSTLLNGENNDSNYVAPEEVLPPPADQLTCERVDGETYCSTQSDEPDGKDGKDIDEDETFYWPEPAEIRDLLLTSEPHSGGALEIVGSGGFVVFILGLCLLLARPLRFVLFPIAAVGSMALTTYVLHVLDLAISYEAALFTESDASGFWIIVLLLVLFAVIWRAFLGTGPMERGLRAITRCAQREPDTPFAGRGRERKVGQNLFSAG